MYDTTIHEINTGLAAQKCNYAYHISTITGLVQGIHSRSKHRYKFFKPQPIKTNALGFVVVHIVSCNAKHMCKLFRNKKGGGHWKFQEGNTGISEMPLRTQSLHLDINI